MIGAKTVDILLPEHKKYNLIESDIYYHYKFMNPNLCVEISADIIPVFDISAAILTFSAQTERMVMSVDLRLDTITTIRT